MKFGAQGEKTGWTYIVIPAAIAARLHPGVRKSFRVKGMLDKCAIEGVALLPMGEGEFIMPLNASMRKQIGKAQGSRLNVSLEPDPRTLRIARELIECLRDEPEALLFFKSLARSHQGYFSKWIESAKTEQTRARRIALSVNALAKGHGFSQMLREQKQNRGSLGI